MLFGTSTKKDKSTCLMVSVWRLFLRFIGVPRVKNVSVVCATGTACNNQYYLY
jgi:hypothetical protein